MSTFMKAVKAANSIANLEVLRHKYVTETPTLPSYINPEKKAYFKFLEAKARNFQNKTDFMDFVTIAVFANLENEETDLLDKVLTSCLNDKDETQRVKEASERRLQALKEAQRTLKSSIEKDFSVVFSDGKWADKKAEKVKA